MFDWVGPGIISVGSRLSNSPKRACPSSIISGGGDDGGDDDVRERISSRRTLDEEVEC